jgi:hypothetical protein
MSGSAGGALPARPLERTPADGLRRIHVGLIDAVVAGESLAHVAGLAAQQLGGRVAIVLPGLDLAVIEPGPADTALAAVRRYVAERRRGGPVDVPEGLVAEAVVRSGAERLGSVALLDVEPEGNAGDVLQLTALAALTAVTLDQDERVTRRRASASLLDDLHAGDASRPAELLARAARLGCDLGAGAAALCVRPGPGAMERVLATIDQEFPDAIAAARGHQVEALLPAASRDAPESDARRLARRLRRQGPTGLAPFEAEPEEVPTALRVAALSVALVERRRGPVQGDELLAGSWRLLLRVAARDPGEMDAVIESTVGPVLAADDRSPAALIDTLRTYLDHRASMRSTAAAVYAHRHTVAQRLQRIHAISGHDPQAPLGQEQLALGLKALAVRDAARTLGR